MRGRDDVIERIVAGVAAIDGTAPTRLAPLYEYVDPEALGALFDHADADPRRELSVTFRYGAHAVTVTGAGTLEIDENVYGASDA